MAFERAVHEQRDRRRARGTARPRGEGLRGLAVRAIVEGDELIGVAMHTPPYYLFVPRLAPHVAVALAERLVIIGRAVGGINGEKETVAAFVDNWVARTGSVAVNDRAMRLYRLAALDRPQITGSARLATPSDRVACSLVDGGLPC